MSIGWEAAGASDVGRVRSGNEDAFRMDVDRGVFLVADGMGGHAAGEVASRLAADTAAERLAAAVDDGVRGAALDGALRRGFLAAYDALLHCCAGDPATRGMGTTLTACVLEPSGTLRAGHIGDSRLYRLRAGRLKPLTHDHTWVQREVDAGRLSPAAAEDHPHSHILSRVLSEDISPEPDLLATPILPGDRLLLCSDGLYNMLPEPEIAAILAGPAPLPALAASLVDAANAAGGVDNVTVVIIVISG
ncbi:MAG TPA: protein phosphatase 2C domain-containing protein [Longimicrobiaceae bacterium]|nr:protein phosphatase 2C domain-containing protein [Longimicrobiaceae bacterium]